MSSASVLDSIIEGVRADVAAREAVVSMAEIRAEFFKAPYPASAAVQAQLLNPEWLVEIECIAVV